jgi:septum formation protein
VTTRVRFSSRHRDWLEWYLDSGEPRGKAGGYGLQGLASLFAERIEGSITNIVGLPLEALREMLAEGVAGRGARGSGG